MTRTATCPTHQIVSYQFVSMHLPQHYLGHLKRVFLALIIPSPGEEGSKSFLLVIVACSNSAVLKNETAVNTKLLNKEAL